MVCRSCFDRAQKSLPLPLRPPEPECLGPLTYVRSQGVKRKRSDIHTTRKAEGAQHYKKLRTERRSIKNLRIHSTLLGTSPAVFNVRSRLKKPIREMGPSQSLRAAPRALVHRPLDQIESAVAPRNKIGPSAEQIKEDSTTNSTSLLFSSSYYIPNRSWGIQSSSEPSSESKDAAYILLDLSVSGLSQDSKLTAKAENNCKRRTQDALSEDVISYDDRDRRSPEAPTLVSEPFWFACSDNVSIQTAETAPPKLERERFVFTSASRDVPTTRNPSHSNLYVQSQTKGTNTREVESKQSSTAKGPRALACIRCRLLKKTVRPNGIGVQQHVLTCFISAMWANLVAHADLRTGSFSGECRVLE